MLEVKATPRSRARLDVADSQCFDAPAPDTGNRISGRSASARHRRAISAGPVHDPCPRLSCFDFFRGICHIVLHSNAKHSYRASGSTIPVQKTFRGWQSGCTNPALPGPDRGGKLACRMPLHTDIILALESQSAGTSQRVPECVLPSPSPDVRQPLPHRFGRRSLIFGDKLKDLKVSAAGLPHPGLSSSLFGQPEGVPRILPLIPFINPPEQENDGQPVTRFSR